MVLGSGAAWRRKSTPLAHDLTLARHVRTRAIRSDPASCYLVVPRDKGFPSIPHQKARSVHRGVRKAPERVCVVGEEVGRDQGIFARPDHVAAERATSPASFDSLHA